MSCLGSDSKLFRWRNAPSCPIRVIGKSEAAFDEVDGTHNGLMMWKHLGGGMKDWLGFTVHVLSGSSSRPGLRHALFGNVFLSTPTSCMI